MGYVHDFLRIIDTLILISTSATAGINTSINYTCSAGRGALLFLKDAAIHQACYVSKYWKKYIAENLKIWQTYLKGQGLDVHVDQLVVVHGVTKTSAWETIVWTPDYRGSSGSLSKKYSTSTTSKCHCRSWPPRRGSIGPHRPRYRNSGAVEEVTSGAATTSTTVVRDQTVFICCYEVKSQKWFWQRKVKVGTDYRSHLLPPLDDIYLEAVIGTNTTREVFLHFIACWHLCL